MGRGLNPSFTFVGEAGVCAFRVFIMREGRRGEVSGADVANGRAGCRDNGTAGSVL